MHKDKWPKHFTDYWQLGKIFLLMIQCFTDYWQIGKKIRLLTIRAKRYYTDNQDTAFSASYKAGWLPVCWFQPWSQPCCLPEMLGCQTSSPGMQSSPVVSYPEITTHQTKYTMLVTLSSRKGLPMWKILWDSIPIT